MWNEGFILLKKKKKTKDTPLVGREGGTQMDN
jgi:hypothetical protein